MGFLGIDLDLLTPAERRDLANALLRAAWSAALEDTRVLLLDLLLEVDVRRKKSAESVEVGSVGMHGQRLTIRIITDELLVEHKLNKVKYEVMSNASPYYGKVDLIYSAVDVHLSAGHTYHVRVNHEQRNPGVVKVLREIS
jgi:hypothetical protein